MQGTLQNKVALITGATSGIGAAIAKGFSDNGAKVSFCGRRQAEGEKIAATLSGDRHFEVCDVSDANALQKFVSGTAERFGRLDVALNCAGISCPDTKFADIGVEEFDQMIAINLRGVFLAMKYEIRQFVKQNSGGSIINMGSILGQSVLSSAGEYSAGHYVAAKHGVEGLTKSAAMDYGRKGIRVNSIAPGIVATAFADHLIEADVPVIRNFVAQTALGRVATVHDIVGAAIFLASDASAYITGTALAVDGGYLAQ